MMDHQEEIVCRCEEVTEREIIEAIDSGATTQDAVKKLTRAGMGLCQGRTCRRLIASIIETHCRYQQGFAEPYTYRPPVRPISLETLAADESD